MFPLMRISVHQSVSFVCGYCKLERTIGFRTFHIELVDQSSNKKKRTAGSEAETGAIQNIHTNHQRRKVQNTIACQHQIIGSVAYQYQIVQYSSNNFNTGSHRKISEIKKQYIQYQLLQWQEQLGPRPRASIMLHTSASLIMAQKNKNTLQNKTGLYHVLR
jgi:hypothetical protein